MVKWHEHVTISAKVVSSFFTRINYLIFSFPSTGSKKKGSVDFCRSMSQKFNGNEKKDCLALDSFCVPYNVQDTE